MVVGTTAAFMGLTVGCARCHNHKYDPIGQRDYYRLIAVFSPSIRVDIPLAPKGVAAKYESEIKDVEDRIEVIQNQIRDLENPLHQRLLEVKYGALPEPLQVALKTDPAKRTEAQRRQAEAQSLESVTVTDAELTAAMSEGDRKKVEALWKGRLPGFWRKPNRHPWRLLTPSSTPQPIHPRVIFCIAATPRAGAR